MTERKPVDCEREATCNKSFEGENTTVKLMQRFSSAKTAVFRNDGYVDVCKKNKAQDRDMHKKVKKKLL